MKFEHWNILNEVYSLLEQGQIKALLNSLPFHTLLDSSCSPYSHTFLLLELVKDF